VPVVTCFPDFYGKILSRCRLYGGTAGSSPNISSLSNCFRVRILQFRINDNTQECQ
jgi:hypothetical protein